VCGIAPAIVMKYGDYDYTHGFNVQPNTFPFVLRARKGREKKVEEKYQ
jgi:hypothetical protein